MEKSTLSLTPEEYQHRLTILNRAAFVSIGFAQAVADWAAAGAPEDELVRLTDTAIAFDPSIMPNNQARPAITQDQQASSISLTPVDQL